MAQHTMSSLRAIGEARGAQGKQFVTAMRSILICLSPEDCGALICEIKTLPAIVHTL